MLHYRTDYSAMFTTAHCTQVTGSVLTVTSKKLIKWYTIFQILPQRNTTPLDYNDYSLMLFNIIIVLYLENHTKTQARQTIIWTKCTVTQVLYQMVRIVTIVLQMNQLAL
jgi:hypothetical protein